ncbi:T6SS immunity protein Tli4 family protein [Paraburkholderia domus]|uniref:T6SS immunity protein Tli4 family protein n=1 Tax=Paraburkholderia domus TaxID=2793075 RepID=UPI001B8CD243|nr:T6SS immunity protein Tli4 family protein [Paraburkholderia domus]
MASIVVAMLLGCGPTAKEKKVIEDLTSKMKTVCVGRFLMNVPHDVKINGQVKLFYGLDEAFKTVDVSIEAPESTVATMRATVDAEAGKVNSDKNWMTKKSMLLEHRAIDDHSIYLRKQYSFESEAGSKHELHLLVGTTQLVLTADSYEGVPDAGRFEPGGKVESPEQVAARLLKIAREIRAHDTAENAGPGYCLGPVVIDSDQDEEEGNAYMTLDRYPDLLLTTYSRGLVPDQPSDQLARRVKATEGFPEIHVFRNRDATLGGMKAHEWLARRTDSDHDDITLLKFVAESMRPYPALMRPYLNINLNTGGQLTRGPEVGTYVSSSLTPKEAMGLWDAMIPSIRVRPDAMRLKGNGNRTSP